MKRAKISGERRERLIAMLASRDGDPPGFDDLPAFMAAGSRLFSDLHKCEQARSSQGGRLHPPTPQVARRTRIRSMYMLQKQQIVTQQSRLRLQMVKRMKRKMS